MSKCLKPIKNYPLSIGIFDLKKILIPELFFYYCTGLANRSASRVNDSIALDE